MSTLPPLPSLRTLTRELKQLHEAWSHPDAGGDYVYLVCEDLSPLVVEWKPMAAGQSDNTCVARLNDELSCVFGWEYIPGDGKPFDATAAARRLLAVARDAGCR